MMSYLTRRFGWLLLCLLLVGCGFHLRGYNSEPIQLPAVMASTFVDALPGSLIATNLRDRLKENGATLVESEELASAVLRLSDEESKRRVLSVDDETKAVGEYELTYLVTFELYQQGHQPQGSAPTVAETEPGFRIPLQTLSVSRAYQYDVGGVLGKSQEETLLREDMQRDLARLILYRLQAAAK